jgi:hypothetical protein
MVVNPRPPYLQRVASSYDRWALLNRGGYNNVNSVPSNGLAELDGPLDWLKQGGDALMAPANEKLNQLDTAIKALLVMGAVSSLTGLAILFGRR